ncbi:hypothetical protein M4R23_09010 [Acidovorax sp. GBBC 3332]|nr:MULTISPECIES: hypothetical protein [unclassified Acidovorax]MDA8449822.1 hypothetical protein [Acidovorax sp. GBBC 3297]MDA8459267.1 hypothetical protein [Acidovorax sp. GBBC 3333]MDA8464304.1 hypothetical protein [Acidovorax sp. GBBC 3332]MDA8469486.1 hypothetical protein [Acidovorax sp. GBBC 3299]
MTQPPYRLIALAVLICASVYGVKRWEGSLIARGDAQGASRVQAAWDRQEGERREATARDNATKFRNTERVTDEDARRATARATRDAAAAAAVRSLRAEIARLAARPDPYPAGDAGLAACAREAATARELLGASSDAYRAVAAAADGLRDQVIGLQAFARDVCHAPMPAPTTTTTTTEGAPIDR